MAVMQPEWVKEAWGSRRTLHFSFSVCVEEWELTGAFPRHRTRVNYQDITVLDGRLLAHFYKDRTVPGSVSQQVPAGGKITLEPGQYRSLEALDGPVHLIVVWWKDHLTAADVEWAQ